MKKTSPYMGPIVCDSFKKFIDSSFTVLSVSDKDPFRLPLTPLLITLNNLKYCIGKKPDIFKDISVIIPQISDLSVVKGSEYNPFSKNYKKIEIFEGTILLIYLPLLFTSILFTLSSNNLSTVNYSWKAFKGFVLRDVLPQPIFDTSIYFYRLDSSATGEPIFSYRENRYKLINIATGLEYKYKSGLTLFNEVEDNIKTFYYSSMLQDLMEEIIDIYDINFISSPSYNVIDYKNLEEWS